MTARITVYAAAQGLYIVYADHRLVGRVVNRQGKGGGWFFRREDRKDDPGYAGRRVTRELHNDAALHQAIAEELA